MALCDLWAFCEAVYAEPDMEAACLSMQDNNQVNVLALLWCAWLHAQQTGITIENLQAGNELVTRKSASVLVPLRTMRRALKTETTVPEAVGKEVRAHLLRAELVVERHLLQELENQAAHGKSGVGDAYMSPLDMFAQLLRLDPQDHRLEIVRAAAASALGKMNSMG